MLQPFSIIKTVDTQQTLGVKGVYHKKGLTVHDISLLGAAA